MTGNATTRHLHEIATRVEHFPMTPAEFAARMKSIIAEFGGDKEAAHSEADGLLVRMLTELGYGEGAEAFAEAARKWWYA